MIKIILLVVILCLFIYLCLVVFGVSMLGGRIDLSTIILLLIPMAMIIYLSSDLIEDYKLTHPSNPRISFVDVKKGDKLLVDDKIVEFEKYVDGKVVVKYDGKLLVYKEKFNKFERVGEYSDTF